MGRWTTMMALVLAMACGSDDGGTTGSGAGDAGTPDVSATSGGVEATGGTGTEGMLETLCLDMVARGRFEAAIEPCTEAVRESPASQEIAQALATAEASVSEAAAQGEESADEAIAGANQAVDDAKASAQQTTGDAARALER